MTKLLITLSTGFYLAVFTSCRTSQTTTLSPAEISGKQLVSQTARTQDAVTTPDGSIRQNGVVKVYGVNRYVDPADPTMMHERHAIYRLEQQPSWVTRSPKKHPEVILGSVVGLRNPEYAPEPLPGESAQQIAQTRRTTEETAREVKVNRDSQEKLAGQVTTLSKQTTETEQKLTTVVSLLNERVKRLEADGGAADVQNEQRGASGEPNVTVHAPQ
jgi:hypothetical protein